MLYGSELQRTLGKYSKTGGIAEDENTNTSTTSLATLKSNTGDERKQPLQQTTANKPTILGESKRYSLNDKSNRSNQLPSISTCIKDKENQVPTNKQRLSSVPEHGHIQQKRSSTLATNDNTTETTTKSELDKTATESAEAATTAEELQVFFEDNKRRYKSNTDDNNCRKAMLPTPVMAIIVPERMKARLREKYLSSSKRSYDNMYMYKRGENLLSTLKRQKSGNHEDSDPSTQQSNTLNTSEASTSSSQHKNKPTFKDIESVNYERTDLPVDQETYDEARELEQKQEQRAQRNLLKDSQTHHKSKTMTDTLYGDNESNDPMLVAEYANDIFNYLKETEADTMVEPNYITIQHEVTWRMRDVLIDWVIEVHYMFRLLPETLFLTVNIIDRFLAKRDVSMSKLQLVAIASLFVATKFEETATPTLKQYIYMTGNAVTEEDLLKSERYILQILDFKLCYPNPLHFLRKCTMTASYDIHVRLLAKYFMEITFIDHRFLGTPPSLVAASALWLSLKMLCKGVWTPELVSTSGYSVREIKPVVELILDYLSQPVNNGSFFKKWSSKRMMKVSIFVRDWVQRFYG